MPGQEAAQLTATAGLSPATLVAGLPGEGRAGGWEVGHRVTSAAWHPFQGDAVVTRRPAANAITPKTQQVTHPPNPLRSPGVGRERAPLRQQTVWCQGVRRGPATRAKDDDVAELWRLGGACAPRRLLAPTRRAAPCDPVHPSGSRPSRPTERPPTPQQSLTPNHGRSNRGADANTAEANSEADASEPDHPDPRR